MAATRNTKTKTASSPIKLALQDTRLKKLNVEVLLPAEQTKKGQLEVTYDVRLPSEINLEDCLTLLLIKGKGVDKEDASREAFKFEVEMLGKFSLSRAPIDDVESERLALDMANFVAPVLADTIETAMFKTGYPRIRVPRTIPELSE